MHCCTWVGNKKKLFFAAILDLNYRRKQDTNDLLLQFNFSPKQPKKAFLLPGHNINFLVCWPTLLVFQKNCLYGCLGIILATLICFWKHEILRQVPREVQHLTFDLYEVSTSFEKLLTRIKNKRHSNIPKRLEESFNKRCVLQNLELVIYSKKTSNCRHIFAYCKARGKDRLSPQS